MRRPVAILAATAASLLSACGPSVAEIHPGYVWQPLGNGIYVHSRYDPFAAPVDGNSTIIVNDEDVVVVDTHINPAAARAVIGRIRQLTDKPVSYVVNTHWHDDHVNGNHAYRQAFPGVRFIAHRATLASLRSGWQDMEDLRRTTFERVRGRDLNAIADSTASTDADRATGIRLLAGYRDALEPELAGMELVYPDSVFDDRLTLQRGNRTIIIQWMGRANTEGDALVWLPEERVLVTGDVLVAPVPYAFDAPMVDWPETLRRVAQLDPRTIIPGHGPVQHDTGYLHEVRDLILSTVAAVREARDSGAGVDDLASVVDLRAQEEQFTLGEEDRAFAWRSYYLQPALRSAWVSLGFPVPP